MSIFDIPMIDQEVKTKMKNLKSAVKNAGLTYRAVVIVAVAIMVAAFAQPVLAAALAPAAPKTMSVSYSIVLAPGQGDSFWIPCPAGAPCQPDHWISAFVSVTVGANGTGGLLQYNYGTVNPITSGEVSTFAVPTFKSGTALSLNYAAYFTTISNHNLKGHLLFQITWVGTYDPQGQ